MVFGAVSGRGKRSHGLIEDVEIDENSKNDIYGGDPMNDVFEAREGIFEFKSPQMISTEQWAKEHLDCNAIIDDLGNHIVVYAFTKEPKYNYALSLYKEEKHYTKQFILRGISSDGLNSLF